MKHVKTLAEFDRKAQNQFSNLFGDPCQNDFLYHQRKEIEPIPAYSDIEWHALSIGLENYSLVAGLQVFNILTTTKGANKQAQLFNTLINTLYGIQKAGVVNRYWKALTDSQKAELDTRIADYLVFEYNKQVDEANYYD